MSKVSVMFVCLGNICRSPLAEAMFKQEVNEKGYEDQFLIESSGTSNYHIGEPPDQRTQKIARKYNVLMRHQAQQFKTAHFTSFDYIIVMDDSNKADVMELAPAGMETKVLKYRKFDKEAPYSDVPDPWFGGEEGFEENYQISLRCSSELLKFILEEHNL